MVDVPACGGAVGASGKTSWALDLQLFWGFGATQFTHNNGNLASQLIQTCNGPGYRVAVDAYGNLLAENGSGSFPGVSAAEPPVSWAAGSTAPVGNWYNAGEQDLCQRHRVCAARGLPELRLRQWISPLCGVQPALATGGDDRRSGRWRMPCFGVRADRTSQLGIGSAGSPSYQYDASAPTGVDLLQLST